MFRENQQIGGYTLIKQIGRGGFGEVWLAERRTEILTTQVAIKLPHREQVNLEAIRQEAALWAKASGHANILPIIEANIYDGQIVIVSEYAPDGSLEERIQQEIPIKQTLETVIGILNGLDFLHSRQIIHRDIKPANILLQGETPRLADFGISRIIKTTALSTSIVGTPKYMAPEAFNGKRTAQTDIWSVGVILYQMLCGKVPFPQDNPTELMYAIVFNEPQPIPESVPPDLRKIIQKALDKQPENRYQSAREMREELQRALLNISHPTFAPTEVLEKKPLDNQTIEDRSIFTDQPLPVPTNPQNQPAIAPLVDRSINQNQPPANIPIEYNPILPTVSSAEPQYQEPPQTVSQVTEITNQQKRGFHWGFYFLPPLIDIFLMRGFTIVLSLILSEALFGKTSDLYQKTINMMYFAVPMGIIVYGILGAIFGYFFPQGKWKWGILLNLPIFIFIPYLRFSILWFLVTAPVACLSAYIAARLSPRNPQTALTKSPEAWTTARIVQWIFYFLAPVIGGLVTFRSFFEIILIAFPIFGVILGYFFPSAKWKWGIWLNIVSLIVTFFGSIIKAGSGSNDNFFLGMLGLTLTTTALSCLTSYLGSKISPRKTADEIAKPPEKWTTARIVRWVFYFLAPIIGILTYLTFQQITRFFFYQRDKYGWSYEAFLVIDFILIIFLIVLVFGTIGALLGYFFPQQKWRWGLWLNLINLIWIVRLYLVRFGSGYYSTQTAGLLVFVELIRFSAYFIVPCLTSYLGSWLALRKAEKKVLNG